VQVLARIGQVAAAQWDRCAGDEDPFVSHAYLSALEDSGCVSEATGFRPCHVLLRDGPEGAVAAAIPLYLKSHSDGEYGPDAGWSDVYRGPSAGYYPKLLSEVPFTPVMGRRILVSSGARDADALWKSVPGLLADLRAKAAASSVHLNYVADRSADLLLAAEADKPYRTFTVQYHWMNRGYAEFGDFCRSLRGIYRHAVLRERRDSLQGGLTVRVLEGNEIGAGDVDFLYRIYADTNSRYRARLHLNRAFFESIAATMRRRLVVAMASDGARPVAACLWLKGAARLFLRYWGSLETRKFLHFELTYYQGIEYAIRHGLAGIDGGAAGPHTLQRGFEAVRVPHLHWINDGNFLAREKEFLDGQKKYVARILAKAGARRVYAPR